MVSSFLCQLIVYSSVVVLGSLGLVGNIISVIVWTRPQMKSSSAILLTALAASDSVIIIRAINIAIPSGVMAFYNYTDKSFSLYYVFSLAPFPQVWMFIVSCVAYTATMYLTVAITFERYFAVCHPFYFKRIGACRRAFVTAVTVFIFSILFNSSRFWATELMEAVNINKEIASLFSIWGNLFVDYLLPLAGIIILNTVIYYKLKRANRERKALSKLNEIDHQLCRMLLYVVVEFLMCTSATGFWAIWSAIVPEDYIHYADPIWTILPLRIFLDTFNASVNFFTYVTFWGPFRRTFMQMFCCRKENVQHTLQVNTRDQKWTSDTTDTLI